MNCLISRITDIPSVFPYLQTLVLAGNPIDSMSVFDKIHLGIPSLQYLSIRDCPVYGNGNDDTIQQEIIARIGSLKYLNRSQIPATDSENIGMYIKSI